VGAAATGRPPHQREARAQRGRGPPARRRRLGDPPREVLSAFGVVRYLASRGDTVLRSSRFYENFQLQPLPAIGIKGTGPAHLDHYGVVVLGGSRVVVGGGVVVVGALVVGDVTDVVVTPA
jgi:hypothetical protein